MDQPKAKPLNAPDGISGKLFRKDYQVQIDILYASRETDRKEIAKLRAEIEKLKSKIIPK